MIAIAARRRFTLDTNLLVYSVDRTAGARHDLAIEIVDRAVDADCWLTLQAICEFYVAVTRKRIMPPARTALLAEQWLSIFPFVGVSASAVRTAFNDNLSGRAGYWDALLVATAAQAGCTLILSEDMADGASLGGVRVHNPFVRASGLTGLTRELLGL